jgi:hypothetical protein
MHPRAERYRRTQVHIVAIDGGVLGAITTSLGDVARR